MFFLFSILWFQSWSMTELLHASPEWIKEPQIGETNTPRQLTEIYSQYFEGAVLLYNKKSFHDALEKLNVISTVYDDHIETNQMKGNCRFDLFISFTYTDHNFISLVIIVQLVYIRN